MDYPALLARLLPPGSYSVSGEKLSAELNSEGVALSAAQSSASKVASGVLPDGGTTELLPDWERVYGITPASSATISSRVAAIQARMRAVGGLSRAYFIEVAAALGYTITISELTPFRASRNRVGDVIAVAGVVYAWRVSVFGVAAAPDLEALFRELKPAHTAVTFIYPAGSLAGAMSGSITVGTASLTGSIRLVNARTDAFVPIAGRACTCGVFSMTSAGVWTYVLNSNDADAVALPAKATLAESVTVSASDGSLSGTVLITVVGIDDAGTISGTDAGNVTEDVTTTCSGVLTVTDPDTGEAVFVAQTTSSSYGTFVLAKTGAWTYTLGAGAQALPGGTTVSDTFAARSVGGASHVVSITIVGTNDVPTITGTGTGSITVGTVSVSGALVISDPDAGQSAFVAEIIAGAYGSLSISGQGSWTYTLNAALAAVQSLPLGSTLTDQMVVSSIDGSATRMIIITISGNPSYKAAVLSDSPVVYWRLDETSGTTAADSSGSAHPGVYTQNVSAMTTGGLLTTDADLGIMIPTTNHPAQGVYISQIPIDTSVSWTVEAVIKPGAVAPQVGLGVICQLGGPGDYCPELGTYDYGAGYFGIRVMRSGYVELFRSAAKFAYATRVHVVLTFDSSTSRLTLYLNGAADSSSATFAFGKFVGAGRVGYGVYGAEVGYPMYGIIDELCLYQKTLSAARVAAHVSAMG